MSSVKYIQPNSLIANINEKIDELNRKIIPTCTLKHSDQKENLLYLIGKFKETVQNILTKLNLNQLDINASVFGDLTNSLEKTYKAVLDEIIQPYEKIDFILIITRLDELEENVTNIPVIPSDLNQRWNGIKNDVTTTKTDLQELKTYVEGLGTPPADLYSKWGEIKNDVLNCKQDIQSLNASVEALQKTVAGGGTK
jgi:hypothetical protein